MNIADKQTDLIEEYEAYEDWLERYRAIIKAGEALQPSEALCVDRYKVKGCQSQVWLKPAWQGDALAFEGYSDAGIVRGLVALILRVYSGHTPDEIMQTPADFVDELGLSEHLSQNRASGLAAMLKQIKLYALALKTTRENAA